MKSILKLSIPFIVMLLICSGSFASANALVVPNKGAAYPMMKPKPSPFGGMTVSEFVQLTPARYRDLTGKRLSFPQKLSLKIAQRKVKKLVRENKGIDLMYFARDIETDNFDIAGFIMGIALGPLGLLIAYIIEGRSSSMFRWALYGSIIWLGLFLLVVLIL